MGAVVGNFLHALIYRLEQKPAPAKGFTPRRLLVAAITGSAALLAYSAFFAPFAFLASPTTDATTLPFALPAGLWAPLVALLYFLVLCILITITVIDKDTQEIPNTLVVALAVCALLLLLAGSPLSLLDRGIGLVTISLPFFVFALIAPGALGGGDIKLMAAAGFLLGWQQVLLATTIGIFLGGLWGVYLLLTKKKGRKEHFAFGPALCAGIAIALLYGEPLISQYLGNLVS
jgi:leader peptidase (prepilin peptidase)/N-methyltransferase